MYRPVTGYEGMQNDGVPNAAGDWVRPVANDVGAIANAAATGAKYARDNGYSRSVEPVVQAPFNALGLQYAEGPKVSPRDAAQYEAMMRAQWLNRYGGNGSGIGRGITSPYRTW